MLICNERCGLRRKYEKGRQDHLWLYSHVFGRKFWYVVGIYCKRTVLLKLRYISQTKNIEWWCVIYVSQIKLIPNNWFCCMSSNLIMVYHKKMVVQPPLMFCSFRFHFEISFPRIRLIKCQQRCRWWFGVKALRPRQKGRYFQDIFAEGCSQWYNSQYSGIGSDNGLTPNRRQPIIWTIDGLDWWRKYASLRLNLNRWWPNTYMRHHPSVYLLFTDIV